MIWLEAFIKKNLRTATAARYGIQKHKYYNAQKPHNIFKKHSEAFEVILLQEN
jgi:hypothetical protein